MKSGLGIMSAVALTFMATVAHAQGTGDVIRIGILNDQSGPYADVGGKGSVIAAKLAVEEFGGKLLGKRIEVIAADHQNKPDIASAIARQWIDTESVDVIADGAGSSAGLAIQQVTRDSGRIFIISAPASSDFTGKACSPTGFHFTYDTYALANGTAKALVKQGGDTWFFITADYAFGHALERDTSAFVVAGGGKVNRLGVSSTQRQRLQLSTASTDLESDIRPSRIYDGPSEVHSDALARCIVVRNDQRQGLS